MFDIDAKAYRVLRLLSKKGSSLSFKSSNAYWLTYLINRGLAKNELVQTEEYNNLGVVVITQNGKSLIKEKSKEEFKVWVFRIIPIVISIIALVVAILK